MESTYDSGHNTAP